MYRIFRPLLFQLDPEQAHQFTLQLVRLVGMLPPLQRVVRRMYRVDEKPVQVFGLRFQNPVGLAAGYDKDGMGWRGLACLGFGHIEIGTVTPQAQPGNERPRLFRLAEHEALINRMGFPGKGAEFVRRQLLAKRMEGLVIGVNIGKNAATLLQAAVGDYLELVRVFAPLADYLAVNVSSPNTIGLRRLQARAALSELLGALDQQRRSIVPPTEAVVPLLVKLSPDLDDAELDDAIDVLLDTGMDGVIVANTTITREGIGAGSRYAEESGGLSGAPLAEPSTQLVRQVIRRSAEQLPVIAVGGVMSADGARAKLDAGARLVQLYTGLVYRGPGLVKQIVDGLWLL
jgi:dihydroorotate dehydrogenase